jgi:protein farnesyltransferase subunit beta
MQGSEIELGGFKGRTNKLVDGCYSWWVGGCAVLTEALIGSGSAKHATSEQRGPEDDDNWDDVDGKCGSRYEKITALIFTIPDSLFNRRALQEYVLYATQHSAGGLVDKPPK